MKVGVIFFLFLYTSVNCRFIDDAERCDSSTCNSADCRCSGTASPLTEGTSPQLISLTFDEGVVDNLFTSVWQPLLFERKNPDGNPIGVTFFVPHEYTDYSRVQDLYLQGYEIGVNSITKNSLSEYWSNATEDVLIQEFQGQRTIISHFAQIPSDDIIGVRTPQLQLQGDVSINAYIASGLQYDSSWTSRSTQFFFPYTLDYKSTQECRTGTSCPNEAHAGFWVAPIIDLQGNGTDGTILECNSLIGCNMQGSGDDIAAWLEEQVERERSTTKAPITLMVPSAWFRFSNNSYEGFEKFLDNILDKGDVFLVTQKQVIEWAKNPVTLENFKTDVPERTADCLKISCPLLNINSEIRYMTSCVSCPEVYPWLGNPLGQSDPSKTTTTVTPSTTTTVTTTTPSVTTTTTPPPQLF